MPRGVYKRTKEHKRKMGLAHIGKHPSEKTIQKIREGNIGKIRTEEQKKKYSLNTSKHKPNCQCCICKNVRHKQIHKFNCQCVCCKNKRGEKRTHKPNCQCCCCKGHRGETKGENSPNYGKKVKHKPNCQCCICKGKRGERKGQLGWNKGLTKETDSRVANHSKSMKNKKQTPETIEKRRKSMKGRSTSERNHKSNCGCCICKIFRNEFDFSCRKILWQNPEYVAKQMKSRGVSPNKPEILLNIILQDMFPNEYKYVGDGRVIIGGKCPDFINVNGQKKIIEFFGNYWHKPAEEKIRINHFAKYDYQTLIIWEYELKDMNKLMWKIRNFNIC